MDLDGWQADAALGGVRSESHSRIRFLMVQVRLGDYKQDSSSAHGEGTVQVVPLDTDELAFRFQVWSATDKAYKQAVEALTDKQARLKQLTIDHPVDDFAHADPVQVLQPVVELKVEREPWLKMLRDASGLYARDPKVQFLGASLDFMAVNRYYLNSEGNRGTQRRGTLPNGDRGQHAGRGRNAAGARGWIHRKVAEGSSQGGGVPGSSLNHGRIVEATSRSAAGG